MPIVTRAFLPCLRALACGALGLGALGSAANARDIDPPRCSAAAVICCGALAVEDRQTPAPPEFGVQVWPSALAQDAETVERLVALGPEHLRFSIGPNWFRRPQLVSTMSDSDLDAAVARGYETVQRLENHLRVVQDIRQLTQARLHLIVWEPPPLPGEGKAGANKEWRVLDASDVSLLARFHVANLKFLAERGLKPEAMELSNEPDGSWNMKISPPDYLALVTALRLEARRRGVQLPQIYGPGTSRIAATRSYLSDPAVARGILTAVDVLSFHAWDDKAGDDRIAEFGMLRAHLAQLGLDPPVAVTEYGLAKPDPSARSPQADAGNRVAGSITGTPVYSSASVAGLIGLYAAGAGTVIYWEFQDQSWGRGLYGLVGAEGRAKPIFANFAKVAQLLRDHGPRRVTILSDGRLAVLHGRGKAFVMSNTQSDPVDIVFPRDEAPDWSGETCVAEPGFVGIRVPPYAVERARSRSR